MSNHHEHHGCNHRSASASVFQTLDEMHFERGLWNAAVSGDVDRVVTLLKEGKNPNEADQYGFTPLHYAARNGHKKVCELLLHAGADVNAQTRSGLSTPLQRACYMGHLEVALLLIRSNNCFVDIQDSDGMTCLHKAAQQKHWDIVEELLKHKSELGHVADKNGKTAFDYITDDNVLIKLTNEKH